MAFLRTHGKLHVVLFLIPVVLLVSFGGCTDENSTFLLSTQMTLPSTTFPESTTVPESTSQASSTAGRDARNETNARKAFGAEETTATAAPETGFSTDGTMATTSRASHTSTESTERQASSLSPRIVKTTKSITSGEASTPNTSQRKQTTQGLSLESGVFEYDYYSLRRLGLIFAAVLFVIGILVLICDKRCPMQKCHAKKANYDLTRC
ncbi:integumentary mucin A.1 isoform X2 [Acipenser oxyrinchus oxyrinchus]|uniref:FXYD domain-containing ion transport regulator n=1 Tax=Acipenser oxyrinchus oxyrinchus TaxID=40147 RepID=A0AAD8FX55_ACIOX|nr:integumentary mucin A.1 isoform X2 [Acipenser oxyrinchus oxyrinchus]